MTLTNLDLFSGIGAPILAAQWAGIRTIAACEIDPECQAVLRNHWPDMPIIPDVKDVNYETIRTIADAEGDGCRPCGTGRELGAEEGGESTPGTYRSGCGRQSDEQGAGSPGRRGTTEDRPIIDILSAGVPCQPASVAGRRKGAADDRWLWPEVVRLLRCLKPTWGLFENPLGITTLVQPGKEANLAGETLEEIGEIVNSAVFDGLLAEIEEIGYDVQTVCFPACSLGANHLRYRMFVIARNRESAIPGALEAESWGNGQSILGTSKQSGQGTELQTPNRPVIANAGQFQRCELEGKGIQRAEQTRREVGAGDKQTIIPDAMCFRQQSGVNASALSQREQQSKIERDIYLRYPSGPRLPDWAGGQWAMPWPLAKPERPDGRDSTNSEAEGFMRGNGSQEDVDGQIRGRTGNRTIQRRNSKSLLCPVDDGTPDGLVRLTSHERIFRLKALGNCNPPQMYYPIYAGMVEASR